MQFLKFGIVVCYHFSLQNEDNRKFVIDFLVCRRYMFADEFVWFNISI